MDKEQYSTKNKKQDLYIVEHSMLRIHILCFSMIRTVIDGQGERGNYIEGKMWNRARVLFIRV